MRRFLAQLLARARGPSQLPHRNVPAAPTAAESATRRPVEQVSRDAELDASLQRIGGAIHERVRTAGPASTPRVAVQREAAAGLRVADVRLLFADSAQGRSAAQLAQQNSLPLSLVASALAAARLPDASSVG